MLSFSLPLKTTRFELNFRTPFYPVVQAARSVFLSRTVVQWVDHAVAAVVRTLGLAGGVRVSCYPCSRVPAVAGEGGVNGTRGPVWRTPFWVSKAAARATEARFAAAGRSLRGIMVHVRGPLLSALGLAISPNCCALLPPPSLPWTSGIPTAATRSSHVRQADHDGLRMYVDFVRTSR